MSSRVLISYLFFPFFCQERLSNLIGQPGGNMFTKKHVKIFCACLFLIGVAAASLSNRHLSTTVLAYAEGPPAGVTGAPGEQTCVECHTGTGLNAGEGQIKITGPTSYQLGQTYTITIQDTSSDSSRKRWGFETTVLAGKNQPVGSMAVINGSLTQLITNSGPFPNRDYIEHTEAGTFDGQTGGATWTYSWKAPSADAGSVTVYVASNFANGDGTDQGDQIHTATLVIPSGVSSTPPPPPPGAPSIMSAAVSGKVLTIMGDNFDSTSVVTVNGTKVSTEFDSSSPAILTCPKGGKGIKIGSTVKLRVKNADTGAKSAKFSFTRTS
jgi:hypothetical protein